MSHVGSELAIVHGLAGVEPVLVFQADHDFVDQRRRKARLLDEGTAIERGLLIGWRRVLDFRLRQAVEYISTLVMIILARRRRNFLGSGERRAIILLKKFKEFGC